MATNYSVGHAMRRRSGIPSNSLEAAGKSMTRNHPTHEEAYEAASEVGSPRIPMGESTQPGGADADEFRGTLVPRHNVQAADPSNPGSKANRQNIERLGAQYRITVPFTPTIDPAAGPTMANARIVPSVAGRVNPNFQSGEQGSY